MSFFTKNNFFSLHFLALTTIQLCPFKPFWTLIDSGSPNWLKQLYTRRFFKVFFKVLPKFSQLNLSILEVDLILVTSWPCTGSQNVASWSGKCCHVTKIITDLAVATTLHTLLIDLFTVKNSISRCTYFFFTGNPNTWFPKHTHPPKSECCARCSDL